MATGSRGDASPAVVPGLAFSRSAVAQAIVDATGRLLAANDALARLTGLPLHVLEDERLARLIEPDDMHAVRDALRDLRTGARPRAVLEVGGEGPAGRRLSLMFFASLLDDVRGEPRFLIGLVDVTSAAMAGSGAGRDELTGLLSRTRFDDELDRHLARGRRYGAAGALVLADVDRLGTVNAAFGTRSGDELLAHLAQLLRDRLRGTDLVARSGDDEFAVLLPEATVDATRAVAETIVGIVRAHLPRLAGIDRPLTISAGAVLIGAEMLTGEQALRAARLALFSAKDAGGDRAVVRPIR